VEEESEWKDAEYESMDVVDSKVDSSRLVLLERRDDRKRLLRLGFSSEEEEEL